MKERREQGYTVFYLAQRNAGRIRTLFIVRGLVLIVMPLGFLLNMLNSYEERATMVLIGGVLLMAVMAVGIRFLLKAFDMEFVSIAANTFTVVTRTTMVSRRDVYEIDGISELSYTGPDKATEHPLSGQHGDHLGFTARDKEVQAINATGNISFRYQDREVRFGRGLSSWEAQKLSDRLYELSTGRLWISGLPAEIPESVYNYRG